MNWNYFSHLYNKKLKFKFYEEILNWSPFKIRSNFLRNGTFIYINDIANNIDNGHPIEYVIIVYPNNAIIINYIIIGVQIMKNIKNLFIKNLKFLKFWLK